MSSAGILLTVSGVGVIPAIATAGISIANNYVTVVICGNFPTAAASSALNAASVTLTLSKSAQEQVLHLMQ